MTVDCVPGADRKLTPAVVRTRSPMAIAAVWLVADGDVVAVLVGAVALGVFVPDVAVEVVVGVIVRTVAVRVTVGD
jgi:hypothetical protein